MEDGYISAEAAAALLDVQIATLYAYVGRKGIRSKATSGSRQRRYWAADIEALRRKDRRSAGERGDVKRESSITLITERGPFYRGQLALELAETADFESVAALLWNIDRDSIFSDVQPNGSAEISQLASILAGQSAIDRAIAMFPSLEAANPKAHDFSAFGMARTSADILRWLAAIILRQPEASADRLHLTIQRALGLSPELTSLALQLMVLSADHGFEPGAFAVRAVAATGVTPWRAVLTGLSLINGRRNTIGRIDSTNRFLTEIISAPAPEQCVLRRIQEGETLPGFGSSIYPHGDPRAGALLERCDQIFPSDLEFVRFDRAIKAVRDVNDLKPNFALVMLFVNHKLGLNSRDSLFILGRAAGWTAHAIEQYQAGETEHREGAYRGPLPA